VAVRIPARFDRRLVENFVVVWLDAAVVDGNLEDINRSIYQLRQIVNSIRTFVDLHTCLEFMSKMKDEKIFLIVSESIGEHIESYTTHLPQIISIYVLCLNKKCELSTSKCSKIRGTFTQVSPLCDHLKRDTKQIERTLTPISIVNGKETDLNALDPSFMYSQLLKEIILNHDHGDRAKQEFIDYCRLQYAENDSVLLVTQQYDMDTTHTSVYWYTYPSFLYEMLNRALRTQDMEILWKMGFFIKALHQEITELHSLVPANIVNIVYRGQG
jgi:hypothetical protein